MVQSCWRRAMMWEYEWVMYRGRVGEEMTHRWKESHPASCLMLASFSRKTYTRSSIRRNWTGIKHFSHVQRSSMQKIYKTWMRVCVCVREYTCCLTLHKLTLKAMNLDLLLFLSAHLFLFRLSFWISFSLPLSGPASPSFVWSQQLM